MSLLRRFERQVARIGPEPPKLRVEDLVTEPVASEALLFTGQRLHVFNPEPVGLMLIRLGVYELDLTAAFIDRLRPGMVFVDAGALYGYFSLLAHLLVGEEGRVFAFEPSPGAFALLSRNVAQLANVTASQVALHSYPHRRTLHDFGPRFAAFNSFLRAPRIPVSTGLLLRPDEYEVEVTTLDRFFAETGLLPDVLKIDTESSDLEVLKGAERILTEGSPLVTAETGDYDLPGQSPTVDTIDFLRELGYRAYDWRDGGLRPHRRRRRYGPGNLFFSKEPAP